MYYFSTSENDNKQKRPKHSRRTDRFWSLFKRILVYGQWNTNNAPHILHLNVVLVEKRSCNIIGIGKVIVLYIEKCNRYLKPIGIFPRFCFCFCFVFCFLFFRLVFVCFFPDKCSLSCQLLVEILKLLSIFS